MKNHYQNHKFHELYYQEHPSNIQQNVLPTQIKTLVQEFSNALTAWSEHQTAW